MLPKVARGVDVAEGDVDVDVDVDAPGDCGMGIAEDHGMGVVEDQDIDVAKGLCD